MNRQQIILSVVGVALVLAIYQLPRVVVENEPLAEVSGQEAHGSVISQADLQRIAVLRNQFYLSEESEKSIKFADSLAIVFLKYQMLDSATWYADLLLKIAEDDLDSTKAALIYYRGFQQAGNSQQAKRYGEEAEKLLTELLAKEPENNFLKNKLAMILVATETPMKGVTMLRDILADEPDNREAILNLGVLAIRSGQHERAIGRFDELIRLDSTDYEAYFYKGVALAESGRRSESVEILKKVIDGAPVDPVLAQMASDYMKNLKNI